MIIAVFGFGSFFCLDTKFNDIDLLLVHEKLSLQSARFAIACKKRLVDLIENLDIIILSEKELCSTDFMKKSKAQFIANISYKKLDSDILHIYQLLDSFEKQKIFNT